MKSLNEVEKIVGLKRRAIQEYEDAGLAKKPTVRNKYGHLLYDTPEIERLWQLRFYKELGYNMTKIKKIQDSGIVREKEELERVISDLKEKRNKLDNLILIAEKMNAIGLNIDILCNEIVSFNLPNSDNVFDILALTLDMWDFDDLKDGLEDNVLSEDEEVKVFFLIYKIIDIIENEEDAKSEIIQKIIEIIDNILSNVLVGTMKMKFFEGIILGIISQKENYAKENIKFIRLALKEYYSINNDDLIENTVGEAFENIEKLIENKYTIDSKEVQNEVGKMYIYFQSMKIFKPKFRMQMMKRFGKAFESLAYKHIIDGDESEGIVWFVSRAIETYLNNLEEDLNG